MALAPEPAGDLDWQAGDEGFSPQVDSARRRDGKTLV